MTDCVHICIKKKRQILSPKDCQTMNGDKAKLSQESLLTEEYPDITQKVKML